MLFLCMICPNHLLTLNLARTIMNTYYPGKIGKWNGYDDSEYWRGITLSTTVLPSFQSWLARKLDTAMYVDYPDAPFPHAGFNYQRNISGLVGGRHLTPVGTAGALARDGGAHWRSATLPAHRARARRIFACLWPVYWSHASVCFIQAQARKIQKWWRELPTEVAMPCAEEVE